MAVASLAVLTGTAEAVRPITSLPALAALVDLTRISRAPARFDPAELEMLNAKLLHETPFEDGRGASGALGHRRRARRSGTPFAAMSSGSPTRPPGGMSLRGIEPVIVDPSLTARAATCCRPSRGTTTIWPTWTEAVKAATGAKGKALFMPLRLALTGLDHGPELKALLPLDRA